VTTSAPFAGFATAAAAAAPVAVTSPAAVSNKLWSRRRWTIGGRRDDRADYVPFVTVVFIDGLCNQQQNNTSRV